MLHVFAVLTTGIAIAAVCGWWRERRALIGERAARRISEAALVRECRAIEAATTAADRVSRAADAVLDEALAQHYQHDTEGDGDA